MMNNSLPLCWPTRNGLPSIAVVIAFVVVGGLLTWAAPIAEIDPLRLVASIPRLLSFLGNILVMPDIEYLPELLKKMLETIEMTLLATSIALAISLPLGFLAAKNTSPHPVVFHVTRSVLSFMRALPELVWALVFVSAVGLGPLPGVMALSFVTVGVHGKFFPRVSRWSTPNPLKGLRRMGPDGFRSEPMPTSPRPCLISSVRRCTFSTTTFARRRFLVWSGRAASAMTWSWRCVFSTMTESSVSLWAFISS